MSPEDSKQIGSPASDGLPQVEETKEMPKKRRKVIKIHTSDDEDDDVTDDSFKNTNLSLMPEDAENAKMAGTLPNMIVKEGAMTANNMKVVNRPLVPMNKV